MPLYFDILGRKMKFRLPMGFAFREVGGCARRQSVLRTCSSGESWTGSRVAAPVGRSVLEG